MNKCRRFCIAPITAQGEPRNVIAVAVADTVARMRAANR